MPLPPPRPLSLPLLTAMVVGSMLASGIFTLPRSLAQATGPQGLLLAWLIAGFGMLMIARMFQSLAEQRPELDAGIFAYAEAGFGAYAGFLSALGYWSGTCLLNVSYFVLISSTFGSVIPGFGAGNTPQAVLASSVILWTIHALILRGVKEAAIVNGIVTAAKVGAILLAIAVLAVAFDWEVMAANLRGDGIGSADGIAGQVRAAMLVTVYAFLGIEGASVFSRYAKRREDVGRATTLGFAAVSVLFVLITLLAYGILPRAELQDLRQPSLPQVMAAAVGPWGAMLVSLGLIVAAAGAFLSRSLLSAEVLWAAARAGTMPRRFGAETARRVPAPALWLSAGLVQAFLLLSLFAEEAYTVAYKLTSAMMLVPYLLVAAFALKLAWSGDSPSRRMGGRTGDFGGALIATGFALFLIWAAGIKVLLASALIYAAGTVLFVMARRERGLAVFGRIEALVCAILVSGGLAMTVLLATGAVRV